MNNIHLLDCTLRDGGYCNSWSFGSDNIKKIVNGLIEANIEIIECGFITNKVSYNSDVTKFTSIDQIRDYIPVNREGKLFVVMLNYGEYDIDSLPDFDGKSVDGIRVAYHKKDRYEALELCKKIKAKGYLVFVQAMVSLSYSDDEFLDTINVVNKIKPYAFYIVDSFGMMKGKDLTRLFFVVEHNLDPDIWIGFHSHNNMQLAFSNAQHLTNVQTNRNLIIDSSVYGMGRGAGNLNTELFVDYLNEIAGKSYHLKPLLILIDEILNDFYLRNSWGYSLPNYISAVHNAHPNYASYLDDKKTLTIDEINDIFDLMEDYKKVSFDKTYIEELYLKYMTNGKVQEEHESELKANITGKKILLIAPGKNSVVEADKIIDFARKDDVIVVSVNFAYSKTKPDYIFVSNIRRFRELNDKEREKCIVTSNFTAEGVYLQTKYRDLLNNEEAVMDNAGLMAIRFFANQNVSEIVLAGFDGYTHDSKENYGSSEMELYMRNAVLDAMNVGMCRVLEDYCKSIKISFLTTPKNVLI